ncbi:MAG: 30S ribosomal protein S17 [Patescibacteria group bacterium]
MAKTVTGIVSSNKSDKTIVVTARSRKTHPLYKKQYTVSKKVMAHDEKNEAKLGDKVLISETRPISKHKHYTLTKVLNQAVIRHEEAVVTEKTLATKKKVEALAEKETTGEPK